MIVDTKIIPKSIKGKERMMLESAMASCAMEGLNNMKIHEELIQNVLLKKPLEQIIKEIIDAVNNDRENYFKKYM